MLIAVLAGRVFRDPFDDEIFTLEMIRDASVWEVVLRCIGVDKHPPLPYAFFSILAHAGLPIWGMRFVSLGLSASSLALWHALFVRQHPRLAAPDQVVVSLLFTFATLTIAKGDALRWYGLFSFLASLSLYLAQTQAHRRCVRAVLPILLGLLSLTNFIGFPIALAIAVLAGGYLPRHWLQRPLFWIGAGVGQLPALYCFLSVPGSEAHVLTSPVQLVRLWLGVFGGHSVGVAFAWALIPTTLFYLAYVIRGALRASSRDFFWAANAFVLGFGIVFGIAKPHAYLWAEPILIAGLASLYLASRNTPTRAVLLIGVGLGCLTSLLNSGMTGHPYRRTDNAPYTDIAHVITSNASAADLVIVADPNVAFLLRSHLPSARFFNAPVSVSLLGPPRGFPVETDACHLDDAPWQPKRRVLVLDGRSEYEALWPGWREYKEKMLRGQPEPTLVVDFRRDDDAWIKRPVASHPLPDYVLRLSIYDLDCQNPGPEHASPQAPTPEGELTLIRRKFVAQASSAIRI